MDQHRLVVFFAHQVESSNNVRVLVCLYYGIQLGLDVLTTDYFEPTYDNSHLENAKAVFQRLDYLLEYFELFFDTQHSVIIIKDAAKYMLVLYDGDHLVEEVSGGSVQNLLEERCVVV